MTLLSLAVLAWLIVTAACAWVLPRNLQPFGITLCTAAFLAYFSLPSLLILTATSVSVFFLLKKDKVRGAVVICLVGALSAIFIWFKLKGTAAGNMAGARFVMPLGLSYYCFRQIHYIFEAYKHKLERHTLSDYLCWLFFLPTIHVGPIHRFPEFLRDLRRRRWDADNLSAGLERVLYGYAKIVIVGNFLIARQLDPLVRHYNGVSPHLYTYFKAVSSWLNLYFQFSGYSDVAIGFSLIMGFHVMENFNWPFLAKNIAEFWQRWHLSLTSWCREYVYKPMAALTRWPFISVLAAMLVLGLWHEFSGRYVLWGLYQGLGIVLWHRFQAVKKRLPDWNNRWWRLATRSASTLLTVNFVIMGSVVSDRAYTIVRTVLRSS